MRLLKDLNKKKKMQKVVKFLCQFSHKSKEKLLKTIKGSSRSS